MGAVLYRQLMTKREYEILNPDWYELDPTNRDIFPIIGMDFTMSTEICLN